MKAPSLRTSVLFAAGLAATAPLRSEEIYFRGLGEVFSAGICSVGPGACRSFLSVESEIERLCAAPAKGPVKLAGHSLGASAAMRAAHGLAECGVRVEAVVMLDPMIHPYDMPRGTRWVALYSAPYWGVGEGKLGAEYIGGSHVGLANSPAVLRRVRLILNMKGASK